MIKSFRHKGLRSLFESGKAAGVQASHVKRLRMQLAALDTAQVIDDMDIPGFRLHSLKGEMRGRWSITVNGNWRFTFEFEDGNAYILDYEDYHRWPCTTPLILVNSFKKFTLTRMGFQAGNWPKNSMWHRQP